MRLLLEARDPDRLPVGVVEGHTKLTLGLRYCGLGAWSLTIPAVRLKPAVREAWSAHGGLMVTDLDNPDAGPLLAGPLTADGDSWGESDRHGGAITVSGVTEEHVLSDRIIYPVPAAEWESQTADSHHTVSGVASTVLRAYVNAHAGPGAQVDRRTPGLTLGADPLIGTTVAGEYRFDSLLAAVQQLAVAGGVGFRVAPGYDGSRSFEVYAPQTRADVLLSMDAGTLRSGSASTAAPTVTRALGAGQGEQEARLTRERASASAEADWGRRIERLVDARSYATAAGVLQALDQALAEGDATGQFSVTVQDTAAVQFGRDYALGDVVPYERRGVVTQDVVREVQISQESGRVVVRPTIGPPGSTATSDIYRRLRALAREIQALNAT